MSRYTSNVKTLIYDPRYHDNTRTEFRLDEFMYFNNWRLANVGAVGATNNLYYNRVGGMASLIQNMYLYDGSQVVDQLREAHKWLTFDTVNKPNSVQESQMKYVQMNGLGFVVNSSNSPENTIITGSAPFANPHTLPPQNQDRKDLAKDTEAATAKGWLDLRRCFGLLRSYQFVPGQMFKNLRLVIEWRNSSDVFSDPIATGVTPSIASILRPQLFVDQLMNNDTIDNLMVDFRKGLTFYSIENDKVLVPSAPQNAVQNITLDIRGFTNKFVRRCLVLNEPTIKAVFSNVKDCSIAQIDERFRISVNGSDLFQQDVDTANHKIGMCTDTFGSLNGGHFSQYVNGHGPSRATLYNEDFTLPANIADNIRSLNRDARIINNGLLSYFGFYMNRVGNNIQIIYSRKGDNNASANSRGRQPFFMNVLGEVKRAIVPTQNGYLLQYPQA
jgi:hypothetical protein